MAKFPTIARGGSVTRLPTAESLGPTPVIQPTTGGATIDIAVPDTSGEGRALEQFGRDVGEVARLGLAIQQRQDRAEKFNIEMRLQEFTFEQEQRANQEALNMRPQDAPGFARRVQDNYIKGAQDFFESVPDRHKAEYELKLFQKEQSLFGSAQKTEQSLVQVGALSQLKAKEDNEWASRARAGGVSGLPALMDDVKEAYELSPVRGATAQKEMLATMKSLQLMVYQNTTLAELGEERPGSDPFNLLSAEDKRKAAETIAKATIEESPENIERALSDWRVTGHMSSGQKAKMRRLAKKAQITNFEFREKQSMLDAINRAPDDTARALGLPDYIDPATGQTREAGSPMTLTEARATVESLTNLGASQEEIARARAIEDMVEKRLGGIQEIYDPGIAASLHDRLTSMVGISTKAGVKTARLASDVGLSDLLKLQTEAYKAVAAGKMKPHELRAILNRSSIAVRHAMKQERDGFDFGRGFNDGTNDPYSPAFVRLDTLFSDLSIPTEVAENDLKARVYSLAVQGIDRLPPEQRADPEAQRAVADGVIKTMMQELTGTSMDQLPARIIMPDGRVVRTGSAASVPADASFTGNIETRITRDTETGAEFQQSFVKGTDIPVTNREQILGSLLPPGVGVDTAPAQPQAPLPTQAGQVARENRRRRLPLTPVPVTATVSRFLKDVEGFTTAGVFPGGRSGVTIGSGVDLGQNSREDLLRFGVSPSTVAKIDDKFFGVQGKQAQEIAPDLKLTRAEAQEITDAVKADRVSKAAREFEVASGTPFASIPEQWQAVIASVAFQFGIEAVKKMDFWRQVTSGNAAAAVANLRNFGDKFPTRRNKEADFVEGIPIFRRG